MCNFRVFHRKTCKRFSRKEEPKEDIRQILFEENEKRKLGLKHKKRSNGDIMFAGYNSSFWATVKCLKHKPLSVILTYIAENASIMLETETNKTNGGRKMNEYLKKAVRASFKATSARIAGRALESAINLDDTRKALQTYNTEVENVFDVENTTDIGMMMNEIAYLSMLIGDIDANNLANSAFDTDYMSDFFDYCEDVLPYVASANAELYKQVSIWIKANAENYSSDNYLKLQMTYRACKQAWIEAGEPKADKEAEAEAEANKEAEAEASKTVNE